MSEIRNGGLDQYGAGPFEQQQFGTAGVEGVNSKKLMVAWQTEQCLMSQWTFWRHVFPGKHAHNKEKICK